MRRKFQLPMTLTNTVCSRDDGKVVARSLDFDLVAVGADEEIAIQRLRITIKEYVEFGLFRGWSDYILFDAPDAVSHKLAPGCDVEFGPPIEIASNERAVITVHVLQHDNHETFPLQSSFRF